MRKQAAAVLAALFSAVQFTACSDSTGPTDELSPTNEPPTCTITSPQDSASFSVGDPILFQGSCSDPEDGALPAANLVWASDVDGQLGTGTSITRDDLAVGSHTISLTGTDSDGSSDVASVSITVEASEATSYVQLGVVEGPPDDIASLAISPNGEMAAFGTYADNSIRLVDIATHQITNTLSGHTNRVTALAFSPDSRILASTGTTSLSPADGTVRTWDVEAGTQIASVETPGAQCLAFASDGQSLAGATYGDPVSVRIWDVNTLTLQSSITGVFMFVALNPDGSRIAAGARDNDVHVMDFATGAEVATLSGHSDFVAAGAYSGDGEMLASASWDRTIRLWDVQTGQPTLTLTGHSTTPDFVHFKPDGTVLASLGSGVRVTRSGNQIYITLDYSDRFLRMWNLETGEELDRVNVESDQVNAVAFSADWSLFLTGDDDGKIRIFGRVN